MVHGKQYKNGWAIWWRNTFYCQFCSHVSVFPNLTFLEHNVESWAVTLGPHGPLLPYTHPCQPPGEYKILSSFRSRFILEENSEWAKCPLLSQISKRPHFQDTVHAESEQLSRSGMPGAMGTLRGRLTCCVSAIVGLLLHNHKTKINPHRC